MKQPHLKQLKQAHLARALLLSGFLLALGAGAAAQAIFLARHVIGRVEKMSQSSPQTGAAYDVATVIVEVPPDKVFSTVERLLAKNPQARVTHTDAAKRSVEFTDGVHIGGIQVNQLGDKVSQLLVSTARTGNAAPLAPSLVERVLNVCRELKVGCELAGS